MLSASRFRQFVSLISLVVLTGCAGIQSAPITQPATATANILPIPTIISLPATPTAEPTETPGAVVAVHIKNVASNLYLYESNGQVKLAESGTASQWEIEDYQGSKRIKNLATGNYISIEHLEDYVEAIPVESVWLSPRWTFDTDPAAGPSLLRNVWHNWEVLYIDGDLVRYGRPPAEATVSQWSIEPVDGSPVAAITPTAEIAIPTPSQPLGSRGATVPWVEYEAEDGQTTGTVIGPDRTFGTFASESSGRQAVQLNSVGEYVQVDAQVAANSIVVRYIIPDAPQGGGITATISLYVNGAFERKLKLTSKYAWSYGGESYAFNAPSIGEHHFYDETRALINDIPTGSTVRLQKDPDDTADYYVIDLIDLEQVGAPKPMPAGYLSIANDCGAVAHDSEDDGPAIQKCIDEGQAQDRGVWIPEGTFESTTAPFEVADVTIRGAGMWYSTIHGLYARFNCIGNNCRYADFAILGETVERDDESPENGFNNGGGTGSRLENIWVEHTKVGYWVGPGVTNGLIILNSRFRNLFADGINFAAGTSNSVVENSHFRNTGDDALASWSLAGAGPINTNNIFRFNTVQIPWRANCFAIYGGQDNKIENNLCADVVTYPGILIAQSFNAEPFAGVTSVQHNIIVRAGGGMYQLEHGAIKLRPEQGPLADIIIKDILIEDSTFSGIEIDGQYSINQATFEDIEITGSGTWGIVIRSNAAGEATFRNVTVSNSAKEGLLNNAPGKFFTLEKARGNSGW